MAKNFLEEYVLKVLTDNGFKNLSEENRRLFLPQFVAEAEKRLGLAVVPLLSKEAVEQLAKMAQKETAPEEWWNFYNTNVPNFPELVKSVLEKYAMEVKQAFVQ